MWSELAERLEHPASCTCHQTRSQSIASPTAVVYHFCSLRPARNLQLPFHVQPSPFLKLALATGIIWSVLMIPPARAPARPSGPWARLPVCLNRPSWPLIGQGEGGRVLLLAQTKLNPDNDPLVARPSTRTRRPQVQQISSGKTRPGAEMGQSATCTCKTGSPRFVCSVSNRAICE